MPKEAVLYGGPQDGARVTVGGGTLPPAVHVGPRWLGDGYAAWSRDPSTRFPAAYRYGGAAFNFAGWRRG
jgi:hypothetical protein